MGVCRIALLFSVINKILVNRLAIKDRSHHIYVIVINPASKTVADGVLTFVSNCLSFSRELLDDNMFTEILNYTAVVVESFLLK